MGRRMAGREAGEKDIYESGEDYLEAILMLREERGRVFAIDIAKRLEVSKASVSKALSKLESKGYVQMDGRDVLLTQTGLPIAEKILTRHRFFTQMLVSAGVDSDTAAEEACHMEHTISDATFEKLVEHYGSH